MTVRLQLWQLPALAGLLAAPGGGGLFLFQ